jgi:hypothetical protein
VNKAAATWLLASLSLVACTSTGPGPLPLPADDPRPELWMRALHDSAISRSSLRGALRLSLDAPDLRLRRPQRLAIERPSRMRVETLGLFGQIAAVIVTDGSSYQFFETASGEVESGEVTPHFLWRLARVDLSPAEAVALLLGAPTPDSAWQRAGAEALADGGVAVEYRDSSGNLRQRFEFGSQGRLLEVETWDAEQRPRWRANFADHRELEGSSFAYEVELVSHRVDARAELHFSDVVLNPELPDGLFVLDIRSAGSD